MRKLVNALLVLRLINELMAAFRQSCPCVPPRVTAAPVQVNTDDEQFLQSYAQKTPAALRLVVQRLADLLFCDARRPHLSSFGYRAVIWIPRKLAGLLLL
jgi:hypothetical protein